MYVRIYQLTIIHNIERERTLDNIDELNLAISRKITKFPPTPFSYTIHANHLRGEILWFQDKTSIQWKAYAVSLVT